MSLCDMVLQKRLDYGSSGYQVPAMPHVPRSAKGKRSVRKRVEINQMCAFDLLATVAGKLLETENFGAPFSTDGLPNHTSAKDSIMQEQLVKGKSHETDVFDHINCNISTLGSDAFFHRQGSYAAKDRLQTSNTSSGHSSVFVKTDTSVEDVFVGKSIISGIRSEVGPSLGTIPEKHSVDRRSPDSVESCKYKTEECIKTPLRAERRMPANEINGNASRIRGREDPMDMDVKPPALVSSDSSVEIPPCADHIANSSIPRRGKHIGNALGRDDDENSSGCTHPSAVPSKAFKPQHIGDRRIRNLLVSKYWKVAPTMLKDGESSDTEIKPVYRGRKMCYTRQRTQRSSFKRRKIFEHCTVPTTDGGIHSEGTSNSPVKGGIKLEAIDSHATLHGGSGASSSSTGQKSSYESEDLHVKFSIKSFKVPELFIEIPETATVGSLKTTVMEAVTAILGGGLRVGVLLQGKKIRDDSKTLAQAGLSHDDKLENLGFTLEPNPTRAPQLLPSPEDFLTLCDTTEQLTRVPDMVPHLDQGASSATLQVPLTTVANGLESDYDSAHSPTDVSSLDKTTADSKALIPLPTVSAEALAVVPFHKSRRSELAQRRIRRPFSVAEVEALVQAVEKLGTGRWRDVKLRAFDNAKHRTYVDLKDKWKTLVHTARITPQQRRGEPVPQELLDRVLAAHAYWAQQQAKLQAKPPPVAEACLLF